MDAGVGVDVASGVAVGPGVRVAAGVGVASGVDVQGGVDGGVALGAGVGVGVCAWLTDRLQLRANEARRKSRNGRNQTLGFRSMVKRSVQSAKSKLIRKKGPRGKGKGSRLYTTLLEKWI